MSLAIPYRSIPDMLAQRVAATPDARAFGYPDADGGVGWMTWADVGARATTIAAGLLGLGRRPGGPGRDPVQHASGVAAGRLRHHERGRRDDDRLPDDRAGGGVVHRRRLGVGRADRRERGAGGQDLRRDARAPPSRRADRRDRRRERVGRRTRAVARRAGATRRGRARRGPRPGRPHGGRRRRRNTWPRSFTRPARPDGRRASS